MLKSIVIAIPIAIVFLAVVMLFNLDGRDSSVDVIVLEKPDIDQIPRETFEPAIQYDEYTPPVIEVYKADPTIKANKGTRINDITTVEESEIYTEKINEIRLENNREPISFDNRAYVLGLNRIGDMIKYNYFDLMNPVTKSCAASIKNEFNFNDDDYLSEYIAANVSSFEEATDVWTNDKGVVWNYLYSFHTSGAMVCGNEMCIFLGVNQLESNESCSEGDDDFDDGCTSKDYLIRDGIENEYEILDKKIEKLSEIYNNFSDELSDGEYIEFRRIDAELNSEIYKQSLVGLKLNNFDCTQPDNNKCTNIDYQRFGKFEIEFDELKLLKDDLYSKIVISYSEIDDLEVRIDDITIEIDEIEQILTKYPNNNMHYREYNTLYAKYENLIDEQSDYIDRYNSLYVKSEKIIDQIDESYETETNIFDRIDNFIC